MSSKMRHIRQCIENKLRTDINQELAYMPKF